MLEADIIAAINTNLSAQVGEVLRKRLEQLPSLEKQLKDKQEALEYSNKKITDFEKMGRTWSDLDDREKKVAEREVKVREAEFAARVISLREQHAAERIKEMREVVQDVFANAKYKYKETTDKNIIVPGSNGSCAYTQPVTDTKKIEVENPQA